MRLMVSCNRAGSSTRRRRSIRASRSDTWCSPEEEKKNYRGKPIRYLVLTHHHMDHTGGTRTFMAEGATVIVPSPDKAYFEKVARMPHTVAPDELAKKRRAAKVQEVKDQLSLKDDSEEIRLYNITNSHVDGMSI